MELLQPDLSVETKTIDTLQVVSSLPVPEGDSMYAYENGDVNADSLFSYKHGLIEEQAEKRRDEEVRSLTTEELTIRYMTLSAEAEAASYTGLGNPSQKHAAREAGRYLTELFKRIS